MTSDLKSVCEACGGGVPSRAAGQGGVPRKIARALNLGVVSRTVLPIGQSYLCLLSQPEKLACGENFDPARGVGGGAL